MAANEIAVDKSGERVRKMFAGIAPRYDLMNHVLSLNIDRLWRSKTLRQLNLRSDTALLDVCTGTGDLALAAAAKIGAGGRVVGSDFCPEMLEVARAKQQRQRPIKAVEFLEADTQSLPFADNEFDIVTVAFGLRNVSETDRGLREMARVCKPGGQVAVLEFSKPTVFGLRQLYNGYFRFVLPAIGQALARNDHSAYRYLPASVQQFPSGQALVDLMTQCGLHASEMIPMTFGVATLYVGIK